MANQYDTNLKLQAIADAIGDSSSSGLISALEDIADAVAGGGGGGSSAAGLVSDNFSETDTYDLGDYCIHNNTLYVCINAITTPGPWDLSDWQATNAGLQLSSLNSALDTINSNLLKKISVQLPLSTLGTSWSPTARFIGYSRDLFGITGKKILSITMEGANFTPASNSVFANYNESIYVASTQNTTLSDANSKNRWIHVIYCD